MQEVLEYRHYPVLLYLHGEVSQAQDVVVA